MKPPATRRLRRRGIMVERTVRPDLASVYARPVLRRMAWLLSLEDREPDSPSCGSFDREHWAWKFRDFPLGMMQSAVYPLALVWAFPFPDNPYYRNERVLAWIGAGLARTLARQHRNGAFDAFAPNEQDPGPTIGVMHGLVETGILVGEALPPALGERLQDGVRRAGRFSLHRDEAHAFVSNHWSLMANAFRAAGDWLGDEAFRTRGEEIVARVLEHQSSEGWYEEYGGADPGYESLGIFHLAMYWARTGSGDVLDSIGRSVEFLAHCVHPDGSVGGGYGARNTALYFPAGLERVSARLPVAGAVAAFMRERLGHEAVVTPSVTDAENFPSLAYTWLEACLVPTAEPPAPPAAMPCMALRGVKCFGDSGIVVAGADRYYAVLNGRKGGVCRVFDRERGTLAYEDAGYLLSTPRRRYSTALLGAGRITDRDDHTVRVEARAQEVRPLPATPFNFLVLRLLNLTVFRSLWLGQLVRTWIVRRLIVRRRDGPWRLTRTVRFDEHAIELSDELDAAGAPPLDWVTLPRHFTPIHMGSARYFHPSQLLDLPRPDTRAVVTDLARRGSANVRFRLVFDARGVTLDSGCADDPHSISRSRPFGVGAEPA